MKESKSMIEQLKCHSSKGLQLYSLRKRNLDFECKKPKSMEGALNIWNLDLNENNVIAQVNEQESVCQIRFIDYLRKLKYEILPELLREDIENLETYKQLLKVIESIEQNNSIEQLDDCAKIADEALRRSPRDLASALPKMQDYLDTLYCPQKKN